MKASQILAIIGFAAVGMAQELPPSPTESIGCEPHGDHWHCAGPRPTETVATTQVAPAVTTPATVPATASVAATTPAFATTSAHRHDDDGDDDHGNDHDHDRDDDHVSSGSLPPSPTASVGCHPHGDHWHCSGPRTATAGLDVTSSTAAAGAGGATNTQSAEQTGGAAGGRASVCVAVFAIAGAAFVL